MFKIIKIGLTIIVLFAAFITLKSCSNNDIQEVNIRLDSIENSIKSFRNEISLSFLTINDSIEAGKRQNVKNFNELFCNHDVIVNNQKTMITNDDSVKHVLKLLWNKIPNKKLERRTKYD